MEILKCVYRIFAEGSLAIDPRDLVRYVGCKHQVLIIDYRDDQADVVQYSSSGQLLVAQVPSAAIVPGYAFPSFAFQLHIK